MSDSGELSDWELLTPTSPHHPSPFIESDPEPDAFKPDYFSIHRRPNIVVAGAGAGDRSAEAVVVDSVGFGVKDWILGNEGEKFGMDESVGIGDCGKEVKLEMGFDRGDGILGKDAILEGAEVGGEIGGNEILSEENEELGLVSRGIDFGDENLAGDENSAGEGGEESLLGGKVEGNEVFGVEDAELESGFRGIDAVQEHCELSAETEGIGESVRSAGGGDVLPVVGEGDGVSGGEGEKRVSVWLKMPLDLLKLCVLKVRPVWSISIAAGIIGMLMLGRKLYKMKGKRRGIPLKIMDDKKASQLGFHAAARLNQGLLAVRRVPIVRLPPPAGTVAGSLRGLDW